MASDCSEESWSENCSVHCDRELTQYCGQCDDVCCEVCVSESHRSCGGICDIQDAVSSVSDNGNLVDAQTRLKDTFSHLCRMLNNKKAQLLETTKKTQEVHHKIKHVKNRIVNYIGLLEEDIMNKFLTLQQEERCFINDVETLERDTEASMAKLDKIDNINSQLLFVCRNRIRKLLERKDKCVDKFDEIMIESGDTDDVVESFINEIKQFCERIPEYTATLSGEFNLRESGDSTCSIMGSCLVEESGTIFVTDWKNTKLKKLDDSFRICESLTLPARACDICRTDIDELAITLTFEKKVQFISIAGIRMTLTRHFYVGELCRSISCYDNKLIVLCGGFSGEEEKMTCENAGKAKIFNKRGELLQELVTDNGQKSLFKYPTHVIASRPFGNFYISDERNGIAAFSKTGGELIRKIHHPAIKYPTGMYKGHDNWIYVGCYDTNTIFLMDTFGTEVRVLLTKQDRIKTPLTPCFDKTRSKLFVGMSANDCVLVFDIKRVIKT